MSRAGWYKASDFRHHPKLRKLARLLEVPRPLALGLVHSLWSLAITTRAQGGDVSKTVIGKDHAELALELGWEGDPVQLLAALRDSGWLDGWVIHDWEEEQTRAVTASEAGKKGGKASGEARKKKAESEPNEALHEALPEALAKHKRREEKKRKEKTGASAREHAPPPASPAAASGLEPPASGAARANPERIEGPYADQVAKIMQKLAGSKAM
jgi:hypothetical protein